jgi:hypothetical protein
MGEYDEGDDYDKCDFYIVTRTFLGVCGMIEKGKILVSRNDSLWYNDREATKIGSPNCNRHCRIII